MSRPTVSVVIPVKDDAAMLERCLEALRDQTLPPHEIVVVDNDSTDLTPTVAAWWGVRCVVETEPGIPAAASAGYDAAVGDVIARLDADSEPPHDWLERVVAAFEHEPGLVAVTGPGVLTSLTPRAARIAHAAYMRPYFGLFGRLLGHPPVFGSNFAMSRAAWEVARRRVHRTDAEVHDDLDLSFLLPGDGRIRLDDSLRVGMSSRPFADPAAFARRIRRGVRTVAVNRDVLRGRLAERRRTA